jgi:NAD(P)-dependent dehydrogenase (short-subunit alcohol dehydrogenase family)
MTGTLDNRHAVVTGVTSGIGLATTRRLLSAGATVTGIARNPAKLDPLAAELGSHFTPLAADLAVSSDRARAIAALRDSAPSVSIFVSNAAEAAYDSPLGMSIDAFRRLFEVNVCAPLELCQALIPAMPDGGHVDQLSSVTARFLPTPKFAAYASTKAAIDHITLALRLELAPRGIRVTELVPGLVDTPIYDKIEGFAATRRKLGEQVPKWLLPDDVADAVLWVLDRPAHVVVTELVLMPKGQSR